MVDQSEHDVVLVGGNLAVMVAALEGARSGLRVLLAADGRPLGGHFRGARVDGLDFDIGRVMVERADSSVVSSQAPRTSGDEPWTARGAQVDAVLLEHLQDLRRAPTPESHVLGRRWPDHVTANRLDVLAAPGLPQPPGTEASNPMHARHKMLPGAYDSVDYATAAAANHGALHDVLFEPFVTKVMGVASSAFLARHHRYAWTPLYWPESLRAARSAAPGHATEVLPEYPFWAPRSGYTGELVHRLEAALRADSRVLVLDSPVQRLSTTRSRTTLATAEGSWSGRRLVLGAAPARAAQLLGLPVPAERSGGAVTVVLAQVRSSAITDPLSCLYLCDPADRAYRITDQDVLGGGSAEHHRLVVEGGGGGPGEQTTTLDLLECARRHLGVDDPAAVQALRVITVPGAKPAPSQALVAAMTEDRARLAEAAPGAVLTGALLHHGASALSDQVAQGWRAAHLDAEEAGPPASALAAAPG